jgi:hypothetical protein
MDTAHGSRINGVEYRAKKLERWAKKIEVPYRCHALSSATKYRRVKEKSRASVQSIMGAQLMRLSICFIERIFFLIVDPVQHRTYTSLELQHAHTGVECVRTRSRTSRLPATSRIQLEDRAPPLVL